MSAPAKLLQVIGLLAKEETTYGTFATMTTTADGVQLQFRDRAQGAPLVIGYAFDGDLGPSVSALGKVIRSGPAGRSITGDLPTRAKGGGTAYSSSIMPSIHRFLKAAGFNATVSTTGGSEKWEYTPTGPGTTFTSLSMGLYTRGELWNAKGVIGNLKFDAADPAPPIWTFSASGLLDALPTDVACPAITYPNPSVMPPLASSVSLTLGSFTTNAVVMSSSFDLQRTVQPRVAQSGGSGHLGFMPTDRAPILKVTLESTALVGTPFTSSTGFDPYNLREGAQNIAASIQYGSTQYNKYTISFPQCQVIDVVTDANGVIGTTTLTLGAYNSTPSSSDDVKITFD